MQKQSRKKIERLTEILFLACAALATISVIMMTVFLFRSGLPLFAKVNPLVFLGSADWAPTADPPAYGILAFIAGSLAVTGLALVIAVPVGIATGVYIAKLAGRRQARVLKAAVELLAGIPSVVYGLFGIAVIAPLVRLTLGGTGYSVMSAALILSIMTLPTIVNVTEVSLRAVAQELAEGSLALGATEWQTIRQVLIPTAGSGIAAGVVLGMGRAIGETMAVLMVAGNAPVMPDGLAGMTRTLTMNVITDMSYASGDHMTALFATGCVLFLFILGLNLVVRFALERVVAAQGGSHGKA